MKPRTMSMVGPAGPDLLSIVLAISAPLGALDAMSDMRREVGPIQNGLTTQGSPNKSRAARQAG